MRVRNHHHDQFIQVGQGERLVVAIAALACAAATPLFLGGRTEQEQEIAMIEHGEDAAVA